MEVHAVTLGTGLIPHKVRAVLCSAKGGFDGFTIKWDVIHGLNGAEGVVWVLVGYVGAVGRGCGGGGCGLQDD